MSTNTLTRALTHRIYLNREHTLYCIVRLYPCQQSMQRAYRRRTGSKDGILGACQPYQYVSYRNNPDGEVMPEVATIYLCVAHCNAGIVSHEFGHAALWAFKFKPGKVQYPLVIRSMKQEEKLLHMQTYAVQQFYEWYWKVVDTID